LACCNNGNNWFNFVSTSSNPIKREAMNFLLSGFTTFKSCKYCSTLVSSSLRGFLTNLYLKSVTYLFFVTPSGPALGPGPNVAPGPSVTFLNPA
jgi:hypothetical protein